MRTIAAAPPPPPAIAVIARGLGSEEPQLSSTTTPACSSHTCRWRPYSSSDHFEANATVIIIALFSALICALSLNAAIRCFLRSGGSGPRHAPPQPQQEIEEQKPDLEAASAMVAAPTLVYSPGLKLAGAEAECTICLSAFEEGESIQVLSRCSHGFHVRCIKQWLSSHTSCPTCRTSIFSSPPIHEELTNRCSSSNSQPDFASVEV